MVIPKTRSDWFSKKTLAMVLLTVAGLQCMATKHLSL